MTDLTRFVIEVGSDINDQPNGAARRNPASHTDQYANSNADRCSNANDFSGGIDKKGKSNL